MLRDWLYKSESSFHNEFRLNSQQLLFINIVIFSGLVLYFVLGRAKRKQPRSKPPQEPSHSLRVTQVEKTPEESSANEKVAEFVRPPLIHTPKAASVQESSAQQKTVKNPRGVFFAFNGHEWEAYEVLGCSLEDGLDGATQIYQELLRTADPSTFDFYETAYNAILKSKR